MERGGPDAAPAPIRTLAIFPRRRPARDMAPEISAVRVRLVQIRTNAAVLREEQESFRARCGLGPDAFLLTNALRDGLSPALLEGAEADDVQRGGRGGGGVQVGLPEILSIP